jgi:hypothetical protein
MKHGSKDWPIFEGQILYCIASKWEWKAHYEENYPVLKGDALRRMLVEQCLRPPNKERVRYKSSLEE